MFTVNKSNQTVQNQQSTENYIEDKKKLYHAILEFLQNLDDENNENNFQDLTTIIQDHKIKVYQQDMAQFLQIINAICDNHHRGPNFLSRINQILQHYKPQIKQTMSNSDIFYIFKENKIILLFLLKNEIITMTESVYQELMNKSDSSGNPYCHFFYPELEKFIGEEKMKDVKKELLLKDQKIFDDYDRKRQEGENDSYICSLIRQDLVEEFITYVNRTNYPLSSQIESSIFETNQFLIDNKETTLIEYSAFYGSILIFRYLFMNHVNLTPSLWIYAIHSNNPSLIHLLEYEKVSPPKYSEYSFNDYISCYLESIKCHHNDIADYIENNLLADNPSDYDEKEDIISHILKYHNYSRFQTNFFNYNAFFYFCLYNYNQLVNIFLKNNEAKIENRMI